MTFQNNHVRFYVSLIGSGEGRYTIHLLKCVLLLSTSQTDWKQSSDILSDISFDILSDISSDIEECPRQFWTTTTMERAWEIMKFEDTSLPQVNFNKSNRHTRKMIIEHARQYKRPFTNEKN